MKKYLKYLVSRFKEFWNRFNNTKNNRVVESCKWNRVSGYNNFNDDSYIFSDSKNFSYKKHLRDQRLEFENEHSNVCLKTKVRVSNFVLLRSINTSAEISNNSKKFLINNQDGIDIGFWLFSPDSNIILKKASLNLNLNFYEIN